MDRQTANTISDKVSDMTVAPTVIVIGSSRVSPNRVTIESPKSVCEAKSDPITTTATAWYPYSGCGKILARDIWV